MLFEAQKCNFKSLWYDDEMRGKDAHKREEFTAMGQGGCFFFFLWIRVDMQSFVFSLVLQAREASRVTQWPLAEASKSPGWSFR